MLKSQAFKNISSYHDIGKPKGLNISLLQPNLTETLLSNKGPDSGSHPYVLTRVPAWRKVDLNMSHWTETKDSISHNEK